MNTLTHERDYWVEVEVDDIIYTVGANTKEDGEADAWVITCDPVFGDWVVYVSDTDEMIYSNEYSLFCSVTHEATKHLKNVYWNE